MARYALCIGINNYPGTENDLSGCVNDATDWAAELRRREFMVEMLLDKQATKATMIEAMRSTIAKGSSGDAVVLTYSGHGTWVPDQSGDEPDHRDEALCPWDIAAGPLLDDDLYDIFLARAAGVRLAFLSDSCHSGSVSRLYSPPGEKRRIRFMPPSVYEKDEARVRELRRLERAPQRTRARSGALLVAGCRDDEYSYDAEFGGKANGAFTYFALQALKGLPAGATYRDWYTAIRTRLPNTAYPQRPNLVATATQKKWPVLT